MRFLYRKTKDGRCYLFPYKTFVTPEAIGRRYSRAHSSSFLSKKVGRSSYIQFRLSYPSLDRKPFQNVFHREKLHQFSIFTAADFLTALHNQKKITELDKFFKEEIHREF